MHFIAYTRRNIKDIFSYHVIVVVFPQPLWPRIRLEEETDTSFR